MPSGQTIITNSLTILGINQQGGAPSASDSASALVEFNAMWSSWSIDEGLITSVQSITKALTTATASYTIGVGGAFNTALPSRIYKAYYVLGANRNELEIVNSTRYFAHNDLTAAAATPDELYPDFNISLASGLATLYLWPVPTFGSGSPTLELETAAAFTAWSLAVSYTLPPGYQDAIQYALAWRLIPQYGGIVAPQVMQTVADLGQKAELRIRTANEKNRILPPEAVALQPLTPPAAQR